MKIGLKLGLSYAALLVLLTVIVVFSLNGLSSQNDNMKVLAFDRFPKTVWANEIINQLNITARAIRNVIITNDPAVQKTEMDRAMATSPIISANLDSLTRTIKSEKGLALMKALAEKRAAYVADRKTLIDLVNAGKKQEAADFLFASIRKTQNEYMAACNALIDMQNELVTQAAKDAEASYNSLSIILWIIAGISLLLAIAVAWVVTRSITKPIGRAVNAADSLAKGDMNVDLDTNAKDETGILLNAMKTMANTIKSLVTELNRVADAGYNGKLDVRGNETQFEGEYKNIVRGFNSTLDAVIGPLNVTAEYVDRISKGDIPPIITDEYRGDFNEIKNNLNTCIDAVTRLVMDAKMLANSARDGKLDTRADASRHGGDFRAIISGVNDTLDSVIGPLNVAAEYVDRIAKGDIPPKITDEYNGDFNEIKNNLNQCIDNISIILKGIERIHVDMEEGRLSERGNPSLFQGDWSNLVKGINGIIDALIKPLRNCTDNMIRISKGDIPAKITEDAKGDYNDIKNSINTCIDAIEQLVADAKFLAKAAIDGKLDTRADVSRHQGEFRAIIAGVNETLDNVIGPLNVAAEYVDRIAKGDIPPKINEEYRGDFNEIKNNLNQCIDAIALLVKDSKALSNAAIDGKLDARADASRHHGDFRAIIAGVNETLDNVIGPLNVAAEYVDRIAKGDIPPKINEEYRGDFNEIKNNLNQCIDAVGLLVADTMKLSQSALEGKLKNRADASRHHGDFRKIIDGINSTLNAVIEPMNEAGEVLAVMATGNLTVRMEGEYNGELAKLKHDINSLGDSLSGLLIEITHAVQTAASSAMEISATAESLAAASQEQSSQADEVASAVEEMSRTVTENAMSANKTSDMAQANGKVASEGGAVVSQTVEKMRDIATVVKTSAENIEKLGESSKQIGEIISVIDDIADQTNLLALNAAIEAARAGEQGRGFAVVADEVRKLAERTTEATKQIASMIKGIQSETELAVVSMNRGNDEVKSGIVLADKAGSSLQEILTSTQDLLHMINQIAAASEQQSATSEEISKNVTSISKVTAESAHRVEDVAQTADELAKITDKLNHLMSKFDVGDRNVYSSLPESNGGGYLGKKKNHLLSANDRF